MRRKRGIGARDAVMFDLMLITEGATDDAVDRTRQALRSVPRGRVAVQLRDKERSGRELLRIAQRLRSITHDAGAALIVNTRADVAAAVSADGVHLPSNAVRVDEARVAFPEAIHVGVSCHDMQEVARAASEGASYVLLSPFAETPGKGEALTDAEFSRLAHASAIPTFALGGIDVRNAASALAAGAQGLALIRGVYGADDASAVVHALLGILDTHAKKTG